MNCASGCDRRFYSYTKLRGNGRLRATIPIDLITRKCFHALHNLHKMSASLIDSNLPDLKLLSKGKVRDIYTTSSSEHLLFVASDRISAYDVILRNVRPHKLYTSHWDQRNDVPPLPANLKHAGNIMFDN